MGLTFCVSGFSDLLRRIANNPRYFFMDGISIEYYSKVIRSLPIMEHSYITNRKTWKRQNDKSALYKQINDKIFINDEIEISRKDLFKLKNGDTGVFTFSVIYWGYPYGMRGKSAEKLTDPDKIEKFLEVVSCLQHDKKAKDFSKVIEMFSDIDGIGLSTYSKLLHFLNYRVAGYPCLILDLRLIRVFQKKLFTEFHPLSSIKYETGEKYYQQYLEIMHDAAYKMKTSAAKIEMFLFTFGLNIKLNENL